MAKSSRVAGVFPIGDSGEFVVAEWFPDPQVMEVEILKMAEDFDDWSIPMQAARETMIESTRLHFERQSDPYGDKWTELSPDYKKEKDSAGFPDQILVRSGDLERAATSEQAWFVAQDAIWFNVGALPEYGPIHQEGTEEGPKATHLNQALDLIARQQRTGIKQTLGPEHVDALASSRIGIDIPQRMFVGAYVDTIEELEAIFVAHLERTVEVPWKSIGGGGAFTSPVAGDIVQTESGVFGTLTNIPSFGGGFQVRGSSGRFVGRFR